MADYQQALARRCSVGQLDHLIDLEGQGILAQGQYPN